MTASLQLIIVIATIAIFVIRLFGKVKTEVEDKMEQANRSSQYEDEIEFEDETADTFLTFDYEPSARTQKSSRNTPPKKVVSPTPPTSEESAEDSNPELDIHSAEEVRRAIIWSEILKRKYT